MSDGLEHTKFLSPSLTPPRFTHHEKGEGVLWSIAGWFWNEGENLPFAGYFFQDILLGGEIIHGELTDAFGKSTIKNGIIVPQQTIKFVKDYGPNNLRQVFTYEFKKMECYDLYIGEYAKKGRLVKGKAVCNIQPLEDLANSPLIQTKK